MPDRAIHGLCRDDLRSLACHDRRLVRLLKEQRYGVLQVDAQDSPTQRQIFMDIRPSPSADEHIFLALLRHIPPDPDRDRFRKDRCL
jgi:hypothetical protein